MSQCIKCGAKFIGTAANPPPDGLCKYCEIQDLKAQLATEKEARVKAEAENNILRGLLPELNAACVYCGLKNMGECKSGFPGCAQADDIYCGQEEMFQSLRTAKETAEARVKELEAEVQRLNGVIGNALL